MNGREQNDTVLYMKGLHIGDGWMQHDHSLSDQGFNRNMSCAAQRLHVAMLAFMFVFVLYPHLCITYCYSFPEFIDFIQLRGEQEVVLKTPVFCFGFC